MNSKPTTTRDAIEMAIDQLLDLAKCTQQRPPAAQFDAVPGIIRPWELPQVVHSGYDYILRFEGLAVAPDGTMSVPCFTLRRRQAPVKVIDPQPDRSPAKSPAAGRSITPSKRASR